jgi:transposase
MACLSSSGGDDASGVQKRMLKMTTKKKVWSISSSLNPDSRVPEQQITERSPIMQEQPKPSVPSTPAFAALIGIDWADAEHHVVVFAVDSAQTEHAVIKNTPEALEEWIQNLRVNFRNRPVAICLEHARGALLYMLMAHDFMVLYPINPAMAASYRRTFTPSQAKNDPTDAHLLMDMLRCHRDSLTPWKPDDELTRKIARLCEERRHAVDTRTKFVQQLTAKLKSYYPQALDIIGDDLASVLACDFLLAWPSCQTLKRAKVHTLRSFFYRHNCRHETVIKERLQIVADALPITDDPALLEPLVATTKMLATLIRDLTAAIERFDAMIEKTFNQHPDAYIFQSFPGAGAAIAPRLLSAFGSDRSRYQQVNQIQQYSGIAPITERSGKSLWIHRRWQCPKFLLQTFHEFAGHSITWSKWAKAYYGLYKAQGKTHHVIVRALAFKWLRIIFACWQSRTPYNEDLYIASLKRSHSPLYQLITAS